MHQVYYVWGLIVLIWAGCGPGNADADVTTLPLAVRLFQKQVDLSCKQPTAQYYRKQVQDLSNGESDPEEQQVATSGDEAPDCFLDSELDYAFMQYWADPYIEEFFTTKHSGDTLIASIIVGQEDAASLQLQKLLFSPDSSQLRYVESHIRKSHQLFDLEVEIAVEFSELGEYQQHHLVLFEETIFQNPFHVRIEAAIQ